MRQVLKELSSIRKRPVTQRQLYDAFRNHDIVVPDRVWQRAIAKDNTPDETSKVPTTTGGHKTPSDPTLQDLVNIARKGPVSFQDLCNRLDLSPQRTRKLIQQAKDKGLSIQLQHDHVGMAQPPPTNQIYTLKKIQDRKGRYTVGVISDTHLGSKYCLRGALRDFITHAYTMGVREILHPGDVLDGMYRHGIWELTHSGLEEQARDLFETLPAYPGLTYHCITGNHDGTFMDASGVSVGAYLSNYFQQRGRNDLNFYGDRGAFLKIGDATIHLWHPRNSATMARSGAVQKHIDRYTSTEKPHILLCGHWHVYCHVYEREVHGIACPTFQGGQSAFSKSLGGSPAIGGLILSWQMTKAGTMRDLSIQLRTYAESEFRHEIKK